MVGSIGHSAGSGCAKLERSHLHENGGPPSPGGRAVLVVLVEAS